MRVVTRLKGINHVKGRYYYHRATGIRLPDDRNSKEFLDAWQAAEDSMKGSRPTKNISDLILGFQKSPAYKSLRKSTTDVMRFNLNAVMLKYGTLPIAALDDRACRAEFLSWRDELAEKHPRAADAKLSALQRVLSWAYDQGLAPANPLDKFKRAYSSSRSDKIWLPEHIDQFNAVASPEMTFALLLALHTGQRQGDLLRLTWTAFDGDGISLIQSKTRRPVYVPCTDALKASLVAEKSKGFPFILTKANGHPWTQDAFKKAWSATMKASKLTGGLHFHDLRGTAVTMLAEAGAAVPEIASITGHSLESASRIVDVYLARTRALATSGIIKLNEHYRNKTAN